jgi:hypothetical protein
MNRKHRQSLLKSSTVALGLLATHAAFGQDQLSDSERAGLFVEPIVT